MLLVVVPAVPAAMLAMPAPHTPQERYVSLERDFEMELLLKADAAEAGIGCPAAGPASAPGSPGAAPQPFIGQYSSQGEAVLKASASLRASRLGRTGQAGESCGAAGGGSPRRTKAPAATEPAERIVSEREIVRDCEKLCTQAAAICMPLSPLSVSYVSLLHHQSAMLLGHAVFASLCLPAAATCPPLPPSFCLRPRPANGCSCSWSRRTRSWAS